MHSLSSSPMAQCRVQIALFPALPRVQKAPTDRGPYQARSLLPDIDALYQASKEHYTIAATLPRDPHWAYLYGDDPADCAQRAELKLSIDSFVRYDAGENGYAVTHWPSLIGAAYPTLAAKPLSDQLLSIALLSMSERALSRSKFQCVEYFSGCGQITYFTLLQGLRVCQFDKDISPAHDCSIPGGLRNWLDALVSIEKGSLVWLGTQCSSFVVLCRAISKRCKENDYWGGLYKGFCEARK